MCSSKLTNRKQVVKYKNTPFNDCLQNVFFLSEKWKSLHLKKKSLILTNINAYRFERILTTYLHQRHYFSSAGYISMTV